MIVFSILPDIDFKVIQVSSKSTNLDYFRNYMVNVYKCIQRLTWNLYPAKHSQSLVKKVFSDFDTNFLQKLLQWVIFLWLHANPSTRSCMFWVVQMSVLFTKVSCSGIFRFVRIDIKSFEYSSRCCYSLFSLEKIAPVKCLTMIPTGFKQILENKSLSFPNVFTNPLFFSVIDKFIEKSWYVLEFLCLCAMKSDRWSCSVVSSVGFGSEFCLVFEEEYTTSTALNWENKEFEVNVNVRMVLFEIECKKFDWSFA